MPGRFTARLDRRTMIADGVADLWFTVDEPGLVFQGGQFVTLPVGVNDAGHPVRRSYSIASSPRDTTHLRVITKIIAGGAASDLFMAMAPGAAIEMTGPYGFFVLDGAHAGDVVLAATGTGMAALLPMLDELGRQDEPGHLTVHWGARAETDLFARDEVEALCRAARADLHVHLSRPSPAWTGACGRINAAVLAHASGPVPTTFYLVGNGAMIRDVKAALVASGVDRKKHIRSEAFFD